MTKQTRLCISSCFFSQKFFYHYLFQQITVLLRHFYYFFYLFQFIWWCPLLQAFRFFFQFSVLEMTLNNVMLTFRNAVICCREEENLEFWFGAQINSTLNFTQSGWLILFSPDLHFRLAKRVSGQTQSLRRETATRTDVPLVVPA